MSKNKAGLSGYLPCSKFLLFFLIHLSGFAAGHGRAQSAGNPPAVITSGSIRGSVLAGDSRRPLRFALVTVESRRTAADRARDGVVTVSTRTDMEGNFLVPDLPPGDYYVTASAQGFVAERERLQAAIQNGADPVTLLKAYPLVQVAAGVSSQITTSLERGAAISGIVQWTDGSAAGGVAVSALPAGGAAPRQLPAPLNEIEFPISSSSKVFTDDRGMYRIAGLPAGNYLIQAVIQATFDSRGHGHAIGDGFYLSVFAPGVSRRSETKPVSVAAGQERDTVPIVVDLRGRHLVAGRVDLTAASREMSVRQVVLTDSVDPSLRFETNLTSQGEFSFRNVPDGTYLLTFSGSRAGSAEAPGASSLKQTVAVQGEDLTDLRLTLATVN